MNEDMLKNVDLLDEVDEEKEGSLTVSDNFGIMLKHYRKIKNLSLKELENLCGVSASYINRLERGERRSPTISVILRLAGVLDISSSVLLAAINIKEPQASEKISLYELLIKHEYLLNGEELSRNAKESLLKIVEHISQCSWSPNTRVRDLLVLSELIDEFKQAV
jgi:transcriptional regulator with XRE-family HTH domain